MSHVFRVFQVPGYIGWKLYMDDSHLASLDASFQVLKPIGQSWEFFQVPGPLYREKGIYDNSHLESIQRVKLGIFPRPRAYMWRAGNFPKFQDLYIGRKVYIWRLAPYFALLIPRDPHFFLLKNFWKSYDSPSSRSTGPICLIFFVMCL